MTSAEGLERPRAERFANGEGRYVSDIAVPGALHVLFVRSPVAHADIGGIDATESRQVHGVRLILTGDEFLGIADTAPIIWDVAGQHRSEGRALAHGRVRYVGDPIAAIVAETIEAAQRAAALLRVDYVEREPLSSVEQALAPGAPRLHDHWPNNVLARGNWSAGDLDSAFHEAALTIEGSYVSGRVSAVSLEARAVIASFDPAHQGVTLWTSTQAPHQVREAIAHCLNIPEHRVRVIVPDVGGAFGTKACAYGEEVVLAYLARRLRTTVRWRESRAEAFIASAPGRDEQVELALALAADGRILGLRALITLDKGAEPYAPSVGGAWVGAMVMTGPYKIPALQIDARVVMTNKTPTGAYRGYGVPEVNFALERAIDEAARRLQLDPAEIRRRNFAAPDAMPYASPQGLLLDSGRYGELLDLVVARFDWQAEREEAVRSRGEGRAVGIGLAAYIEPTNMGPSGLCGMIGIRAGGFDVANVRIEPTGQAVVFTGQTPMGQGIEASLARICADMLTIPVEDVTVIHGDTQSCAYTGYGSGGSRGTGVGGSAVMLAAGKIRSKLLAIASHKLDLPVEALTLSQCGVQAMGDPARRITIAELARAAYLAHDLPAGMEAGIEERAAFDPLSLAISYGVVAVRVELDRETGMVDVQRVVFGHDCGTQISPALVEGQVVGGIVQGIGAALFEELTYDASGRPLVQCMRDYELMQATDVPLIELLHLETPSPFFPNGAKGVGESGVIPLPAAIANAVRDALGSGGSAALCNRVPIRPEGLIDPALLTRFE